MTSSFAICYICDMGKSMYMIKSSFKTTKNEKISKPKTFKNKSSSYRWFRNGIHSLLYGEL